MRATYSDPFTFLNPDPFKKRIRPYYDYYNTTQLKKVVMIDSYRSGGFKNDTMQILYYNTNGYKIKTQRYDNNIPSVVTEYTYDKENNLSAWKYYNLNSPDRVTSNNFYYDGDTLPTRIVQREIKGDETIIERDQYFKYDNDRLIEHQTLTNGKPFNLTKHIYKNGLLVETNFTYTGGAKKTVYTHDKEGQIVNIKEYLGTTPALYTEYEFTYNANGQVVEEKILSMSNRPDNNYQVSSYTYNNKGEFNTLTSTFKGLFQKIQFKYEDGRYSNINMETNGTSTYLKHPLDYKIGRSYNFPLNYEEQWEYDENNNLLSRKYFINGELYREIRYSIEYR